ncbi:GDP-mannose 4,6-dehydratase [Methylovirgula sp. 4M-Z18]|uniref:GDP-mannose 4,6-dehydratase n=1 Tax=Methylovirgula sp. 4M-Z18 TaxID=2293567 RepID=UPI000E2EAA22|nr:GDP-mannose 4,6-dehydratase [Methylovirgula sp. 4M-Z18]RFB80316.1 NAD-dependent epimerase/dehydratase family protein [Methylovirgula sp. 4M-Z18]
MQKTVLLTGSQGFTGRYVRAALEADGLKVVGLVKGNAAPGDFAGDLLDPASLRAIMAAVRPHYVIHLAAIAFVGHADMEAFYRVNLFGTLNLLEALQAEGAPVEKVLLSSSANIYGNPDVARISEDTPPAPINHYAVSKLAMEHMARTWANRLPLVITRPFNYTGVGQEPNFLIPKIVAHFKEKRPLIKLGNIDVVREFNDVRFVAAAYKGLLQNAPANSLFNLCSGQGHALQDVLALCEKLSGHKIKIEIDPAFVRANELRVLIGDAARLNAQLPDLPKIGLEQTLQWMLNAP